MRHFALALLASFAVAVAGCPASETAGTDSGVPRMDAPPTNDTGTGDTAERDTNVVVDGLSLDVTASDAPEPDAAASDAPASDAPAPDAPTADSGLDCSVIGCGPPTMCGEACDAPCGCCPCGDGDEMSAGGVAYVCAGGCWAPRGTGGAGDPCGGSTDCGAGLSCCYPCGIPGCANVCEPSCSSGDPGCAGGCLLRP